MGKSGSRVRLSVFVLLGVVVILAVGANISRLFARPGRGSRGRGPSSGYPAIPHDSAPLCAKWDPYFEPVQSLVSLDMESILAHPEVCNAGVVPTLLGRDVVADHAACKSSLPWGNEMINVNEVKDTVQVCGCPCAKHTCPCSRFLNLFLLNAVANVLTSYNLTYFLWWGSLIGSMRHGGSLPFDKDAELAVIVADEEEHDRMRRAIRDIKSFLDSLSGGGMSGMAHIFKDDKCKWDSTYDKDHNNCMTWLWVEGNGFAAHLDLIRCYYPKNDTSVVECGGGLKKFVQRYPKSHFLPLVQCNFHGEAWPCPNEGAQAIVHTPQYDTWNVFYSSKNTEPLYFEALRDRSLACLDHYKWPSISNCVKETPSNKMKIPNSCGPLDPATKRPFVNGSVPLISLDTLHSKGKQVDSYEGFSWQIKKIRKWNPAG